MNNRTNRGLSLIDFVLENAPTRHVAIACSYLVTVRDVKRIFDQMPAFEKRLLTASSTKDERRAAIDATSGITIGTLGMMSDGFWFTPNTALCCPDSITPMRARQFASRVRAKRNGELSESPLLLWVQSNKRLHELRGRSVLGESLTADPLQFVEVPNEQQQ